MLAPLTVPREDSSVHRPDGPGVPLQALTVPADVKAGIVSSGNYVHFLLIRIRAARFSFGWFAFLHYLVTNTAPTVLKKSLHEPPCRRTVAVLEDFYPQGAYTRMNSPCRWVQPLRRAGTRRPAPLSVLRWCNLAFDISI